MYIKKNTKSRHFFCGCFYLIIVTSRNSDPNVNMFKVKDKKARTFY